MVQRLQRRTRLDADLVAQVPAHGSVCVEGVGLAAGQVERANPQLPQPFPQWVLRGQGGQNPHHLRGPVGGEHRLQVVLDEQHALLGQTVALGVSGRGRGQLGIAAPHLGRLPKQGLGRRVVAAQGCHPGPPTQVVDDERVESTGRCHQPVAGGASLDGRHRGLCRGERGPDPGQVALNRLGGRGRRFVPERPGERVDRERPGRGQREQRQHLPRLAALDHDRSVRAVQAYRPQHGQPHVATIRATAAEPQPRRRTLGA